MKEALVSFTMTKTTVTHIHGTTIFDVKRTRVVIQELRIGKKCYISQFLSHTFLTIIFTLFSHIPCTDYNSRQTLTGNLTLIAITRTSSSSTGVSHILKLYGSCMSCTLLQTFWHVFLLKLQRHRLSLHPALLR